MGKDKKKILVTGGTGYIGAHTCIELLNLGHDIVIIDNLSNSKMEAKSRIEKIGQAKVDFEKVDIRDTQALEGVFNKYNIESVIHFAGLKAVGESVAKPLYYYDNNIAGTINLCQVMAKHNVKKLIFSSSATVYGSPKKLPITEDSPLFCTNPYGHSKLYNEQILRDLHRSDSSWDIVLLRYFNPVGAHSSGLIGEDPNGIPNNLVPYIAQVAVGRLEKVRVFGNDYPTPDGTGVRDYIHVVDLAIGHVKALDKLKQNPGVVTYNLGTGQGYSVLEMIKAFSKASQIDIPYEIVERRPGDVAEVYADPSFVNRDLGWKAQKGLDEMCADTWRWQKMNPQGLTGAN